MRRAALALILSTCLAGTAAAQLVPPLNSKPQATPKIDTSRRARDIPYPGTIQLTVDATDVTRAIFRVHETVPVTGAGDFVLLYPKWLPGNHSPIGPDQQGRRLPRDRERRELKWVRDTLDVYAFHVAVPAGRRRDRRRFPVCLADRGESGPDRRDPGPGEHRVDRQFDVSGRLLRPRHPDPGVGDRSCRLEGRDRAAPERAGRQPDRLSGDQLRDPDGLAADRRRALPRIPLSARRDAGRHRRQ